MLLLFLTVFCGALVYKYTRHRGAGAAAGQLTLARAERAGGDEIAALVRQDRVMVTADPAGTAAVAVETSATEVGVADPAPQKPLLLALKMSLEDFPGGPPDGDYAETGKGPEEDDAALVAGATEGQRKGLLIGVLTDPFSLHSIGMAACMTWARDVNRYADVIFFVGSCLNMEKTKLNFPGEVVCLDTPDIYPPQRKVFLMWTHMWKHHTNNYDYFMKVDHDSYVNARRLRVLLTTAQTEAYMKQCSYIGMQATGRAQEQGRLGLSGRPYCSGLGYLLNTLCMDSVGPNLGACLGGTVSNHSDTEVGRCMMKYANAECTAIPGSTFKQVYYQQDGDRVYPMKLVSGGQMKLMFPREPKATHFNAALLHPLKRAEDFYRFHKQTMSSLRPVQVKISKNSPTDSYRLAMIDLRTTCVHNTQRQKERGKFVLPECQPPEAQETPVVPTYAYVLTRDIPSAEESFLETSSVLQENGIRGIHVPVSGWTGNMDTSDSAQWSRESNLAYLNMLFDIFKNATIEERHRIMIIEHKVMFLCNFKHQLWQVLNCARCGRSLYTEQEGGVLLLGANEPTPEGMAAIEADRSEAFAESSDVRSALCYNIHGGFEGSFAGIYHRAAYGEILSWIGRVLKLKSKVTIKFSNVFTHLADKGYIVRAAFPNLVLPETSVDPLQQDEKDPRTIAVRLRWYEGKYCRRGGQSTDN